MELLVAAGLAALEQRHANRDHQSNERIVQSGRSGVGVLEVTGAVVAEKTKLLNDALDTLDTMVARAEQAECEEREAREKTVLEAPSSESPAGAASSTQAELPSQGPSSPDEPTSPAES